VEPVLSQFLCPALQAVSQKNWHLVMHAALTDVGSIVRCMWWGRIVNNRFAERQSFICCKDPGRPMNSYQRTLMNINHSDDLTRNFVDHGDFTQSMH